MPTRGQLRGQHAEELAAQFLRAQGLTILARNYRCRMGELDIVARERGVLVVAEVRSRTHEKYGGAAASVDRHKQQRLVRAASRLLQERRELAQLPMRFDVIVVRIAQSGAPDIEWIRHAFAA